MLGPAPFLGAVIAGALWFGVHALARLPFLPPETLPWAQPRPLSLPPSSASPRVVTPARTLPAQEANGDFTGYARGWRGTIHAIEVGPTLDVNVLPASSGPFAADRPSLDMSAISVGGNASGRALYVGIGEAMLAVAKPGTYGLTLRVERHANQVANCLGRLLFAGQRLVSELSVGLTNGTGREYAPALFELQPGLYPISVAIGCWHDGQVVDTGQATVLLRRPEPSSLQPLQPGEILRTAP